MSDTPLHYRTITELAAMLRAGETTPTSLTEYLLARVEKLNGPLTAFNLVTADRAMVEAEAAEALLKSGHDLGPLHGIPYAVKDLYDIVGLPTTAGSRTVDMTPKTEESEVTKRLAAAGMVVLGKTITVEFAKGIVGINNIQGTPHNPWAEKHHVPGGSSAGTAVAPPRSSPTHSAWEDTPHTTNERRATPSLPSSSPNGAEGIRSGSSNPGCPGRESRPRTSIGSRPR